MRRPFVEDYTRQGKIWYDTLNEQQITQRFESFWNSRLVANNDTYRDTVNWRMCYFIMFIVYNGELEAVLFGESPFWMKLIVLICEKGIYTILFRVFPVFVV